MLWLRKYAMAQLDAIIKGEEDKEMMEKLRKKIADLAQPTDYMEYNNKSETGFEELCLMLTEQFHKDIKTMNVKEFESAQNIMAQRAKEYEKTKRK